MARYEEGHADAALAVAREANLTSLAGDLERFVQALEAARAALKNADAIRHFTEALAMDDRLSQGWGSYGPEIRGELAALHAAEGTQLVKQGQLGKAKAALKMALKYQPDHAMALAQLRRVSEELSAEGPKEKQAADAVRAAFPDSLVPEQGSQKPQGQ